MNAQQIARNDAIIRTSRYVVKSAEVVRINFGGEHEPPVILHSFEIGSDGAKACEWICRRLGESLFGVTLAEFVYVIAASYAQFPPDIDDLRGRAWEEASGVLCEPPTVAELACRFGRFGADAFAESFLREGGFYSEGAIWSPLCAAYEDAVNQVFDAYEEYCTWGME